MERVAGRVIALDAYIERFLDGTLKTSDLAVTFDDGYLDNLETAFPITREFNVPITIFVASELLGTEVDLGTGSSRQVMNRDQLLFIRRMGAGIGAHSATHPDLRTLDDDSLAHETRGAKEKLELLLKEPVPYFCYPSGYYDDRVMEAVDRAGYRGAVVTPRGPWTKQRRLAIRRTGIYRHDTGGRFNLKLTRSGQAMRWVLLLLRPGSGR
jgi:peptidoglycan/xylan/chitin deacetylase (PgdA/CDA1 family)